MTDWKGGAVPGARPQPEDEATRQARHDILATLLGAYADGELPLETMTQVEAHLLGCDRCRREVRIQQALADRVATLAVAPVSPALLSRVRAVTETLPAPIAAPVPPARVSRRVLWAALVGCTVIGLAVAQAWPRLRTTTSTAPAPVVLAAEPTVVTAVAADFRRASGRDLPGRARDLEAVRAAVAFPVRPLLRDDLRLVGAWTTELDGELAAVLAYRWHDRLIMQYALSDAALFRAVDIRRAFGAGQPIAAQDGTVGVVGWTEAQGGAFLVGDVTWRTLQSLQPTAR
jgi:anti-sigma factor RsiW